MLRNVVYLLSQRSAITVRASRTWWQTARIKLSCSRPSVLREDRKRIRSHARRLSHGRWWEGTAVHHPHFLRRLGPRSQNGPAGHLKKLPPWSRLQHPKNKAKRGLLFKKGKKHNPSSSCIVFFPRLGSLPHANTGEQYFTDSNWPGVFNYCWGTVNFFKQTNHSKQIPFEQGVMFYVIQRMRYYVDLYVHVWEGESLSPVCV